MPRFWPGSRPRGFDKSWLGKNWHADWKIASRFVSMGRIVAAQNISERSLWGYPGIRSACDVLEAKCLGRGGGDYGGHGHGGDFSFLSARPLPTELIWARKRGRGEGQGAGRFANEDRGGAGVEAVHHHLRHRPEGRRPPISTIFAVRELVDPTTLGRGALDRQGVPSAGTASRSRHRLSG